MELDDPAGAPQWAPLLKRPLGSFFPDFNREYHWGFIGFYGLFCGILWVILWD
jgi:hypothetical protein